MTARRRDDVSERVSERVSKRVSKRERWVRAARWFGAASLVIATGSAVGPAATVALGPVTAVSVDEVVELPNNPLGFVFTPTVSGRGEAVTFFDREVNNNGFAFLDNAGAEPVTEALGITVSGDGCVALWARPSGVDDAAQAVEVGVTNRCVGGDRTLFRTSDSFPVGSRMALSFTGAHGLIELGPPPPIILLLPIDPPLLVVPDAAAASLPRGAIGPPIVNGPGVVRVDTATGDVLPMPLPQFYAGSAADLGLDISDDGLTAAVPMRSDDEISSLDLAIWDVPSNAVSFVPTGFGATAFPAFASDPRWLTLTTTVPLTGTETGVGPWVYVYDRVTNSFARASGPGESAYHGSISGDATQVAYSVATTFCQASFSSLVTLESTCPPTRVDVAFSSTPGLTAGVATETISSGGVPGAAAGLHAQPNLSASGRWVTWVSNLGPLLLGQNRPELTGRHAFLRERDGSLAIDAVNFPAQLVNTSATALATVRNTGRTSVYVEQITPSARFSEIAGGSCTRGLTLSPGGTCTVNLRFSAPATAGPVAGTLVVGETGHDPVSATGPLTGSATVTTTTSTTSTTTTTTTTPPRSNTPTTTTTTTDPGEVVLTALPSPIDFGQVAVGIGSPIQTITVTNVGTLAADIVTTLSGPNPGDFFVSQNLCNASRLAPGASCTIDVIMVAQDGGLRSAVLSVNVPNVGGEDVPLSGIGRLAPRLIAMPSSISVRGTTTIVGQGFPRGAEFDVVVGESGIVLDAVADETGVFRVPFAPRGELALGDYVLRVDAPAGEFETVRSLLIVALPTFQPQSPGGPVFGDSVLVTRG